MRPQHSCPAAPSCGPARQSPAFFFDDPETTALYTLSLHDALPISSSCRTSASTTTGWCSASGCGGPAPSCSRGGRSEEHTSELQSRVELVCRLLLEKKKTCASPKRQVTGGCCPLSRSVGTSARSDS